MEQIMEKEPMIKEALDMERMFLMDNMERLAYIQNWKQMMDEANREETIRRLAEERGVKKKSLDVARKMLSRHMLIEDIAELTGLCEDEIRSL